MGWFLHSYETWTWLLCEKKYDYVIVIINFVVVEA